MAVHSKTQSTLFKNLMFHKNVQSEKYVVGNLLQTYLQNYLQTYTQTIYSAIKLIAKGS